MLLLTPGHWTPREGASSRPVVVVVVVVSDAERSGSY